MKDKAPSLLSLKSVSTIVDSEHNCYEIEVDCFEEAENEKYALEYQDGSNRMSEISTVSSSQTIEKVNVKKSNHVHFGHNFINCENVQVIEAPKKGLKFFINV